LTFTAEFSTPWLEPKFSGVAKITQLARTVSVTSKLAALVPFD
jgi:hypothetical protein